MVRLPHRADRGGDRAPLRRRARAAAPADPRRRRRSRRRRTGSRGRARRRSRPRAAAQCAMARPGRASTCGLSASAPDLPRQQVDDRDAEEDVDDREQPERRRLVGKVGHRVGGAHQPVHDPRLPSPLGDQPAGLEADEAERARARRTPATSAARRASRRRRSAATSDRERGQRHRAAGADHHLERGAHAPAPAASRRAGTRPARSPSRRSRRTPGTTARPGSASRRGTRPCRDRERRRRAAPRARPVCRCASAAASFSGCATARCLAERSPDSGCTSAVRQAIGSASASALRCSVRARIAQQDEARGSPTIAHAVAW